MVDKCPKTIGITGGIGSGKSFVCSLLEARGYHVFYTDDVAKQLIRHDHDVRTQLLELVGTSLYAADGALVKSVLANFLLQSKVHAAQVDKIVHKRVGETWLEWVKAQTACRAPHPLFMECALLFESGFDALVEKSVLVSAPLALRTQRVMKRDRISAQKVADWVGLQMPEEEKAQRADVVILNHDATPDLSPLFKLFSAS